MKHRSEDQPVNAKALPCPWCGSLKLKVLFTDEDAHRSTWVYCAKCQASGPTADGEIDAVHKWNDRQPPPPLPIPKASHFTKILILFAFLAGLTGCASAQSEPEKVRFTFDNRTKQDVNAMLFTGSIFFPMQLSLKAGEVQQFWVYRDYVPGNVRLVIIEKSKD